MIQFNENVIETGKDNTVPEIEFTNIPAGGTFVGDVVTIKNHLWVKCNDGDGCFSLTNSIHYPVASNDIIENYSPVDVLLTIKEK
jgi:hypothetical protein